MAKKKPTPVKKEAPPEIPPELLKEVIKGRFGIATEGIMGPYNRWLDGEHMGPYSPKYVPIPTLKFMREHPQLSLGLSAYRGPFFGIDFDVQGGDPITRAFVRHTFLETHLLHRALETILNALDYGFQAHEMIYKLADLTFDSDEAADGKPTPISMLGAAVIMEANDIDPQRVSMLVDDKAHLLGYRVDGNILNLLPINKCLHAVHQMEHRNWRGRSLLKRAYKPWWWSEFLCLYMTRWYERKSDPPYHAWAPPNPRPNPEFPTDLTKQVYPTKVVREQLLHLRSSGVFVTPWEIDPATKQPMWGVRELTDGGRAETFVTGLAYLDALGLRALGVPEEIATRGSVGSQAKTDTVLGVFLQELEIVKKCLVLRTLNAGIIEPLVRFNFGASAPMPYCVAPEFNREQKGLLGELLKLLLAIPPELDGDTVPAIDMLNVERIIALLNVPHRKAKEIAARKSQRKNAATPSAPDQAPSSPKPQPQPSREDDDQAEDA